MQSALTLCLCDNVGANEISCECVFVTRWGLMQLAVTVCM